MKVWHVYVGQEKDWKEVATVPISPSGGRRSIFSVPVKTTSPINVRLQGTGDMGLRLLEVDGHLSPWWGMMFERRDGKQTVTQVLEGPSIDAGFQRGDVILAIDGSPVGDKSDILSRLGSYRIGDAVTFTVSRDGKVAKVKLVAQ
jgi:serine protease Do